MPDVSMPRCLALTACLLPAVASGAGAATDPPPQASFGESVAVDLVTVEVLAVDAQGRPVLDLTREDFRLSEDGRPVALTHFEAPRPLTPVAGEGPVSPASGADAAASEPPGHTVVVIDNLHMGIVNRHLVFDALAQALERSLRAGDRVMVIDYDGSTRVALPFTSSRRDISAALERQREGEARYIAWTLERQRTIGILERTAEIEKRGSEGFAQGCISIGLYAWDYARARHSEVLQTIQALGSLVGTLSGVPGRKNLIYVSDGVPLRPGAAEVQYAIDMCDGTAAREGNPNASKPMDSTTAKDTYWDPSHSRLEIHSLDTSNEWYLLAAQANAQRVTFFPLQASGLTGYAPDLGSQVRTTIAVETMIRRDPQDTLVLLAAETGGTAILHANDLLPAIEGALLGSRETYVLGFTPRAGGEARRHGLRVEVARPGLELRYPKSYFRKTPHGQMVDAVASSLLHGVEANPMGLQVSLAPREAKTDSRIRVSIPLDQTTLLPQGDQVQGLLTVFLAVRRGEDPPSDVRQRTITVRVPGAAAVASESFVHDIGLDLQPGKHHVAVGVYDEIGGALSYVRRELVVEGVQQVQVQPGG